ncbi:AAA family ATPase, partial [Butyricicoccus sp. 1XD8-22]
MARLLALAYLQPNNFEGFIWVNSIDDIYRVLEENQKQVIIFDDFWGSIFYDDHRGRKTENRLNQLIKNIISTKGEKRLILTTREYVLQQGLQKHPLLKETLEKYSIFCLMEDYGYDEKANILFRHLYSSQIPYEFIRYIFKESNMIIYHENYNPRVLALFLNKELNNASSPADYHDELLSYLNNPEDFWKGIFIDLSPEARILSILLLISSTPIRIKDITLCYQKFIHTCNNPLTIKNLDDCVKELEKSVVKTFYSEEEEALLIKFSVPAAKDFLYKFISENTEQYIPVILNCCAYYNQLQFLLEHYSKYCSKFVEDLIILECISRYNEYDDCYSVYNDDCNENNARNGEELYRFFDLLRICDPKSQNKLFNFLETVIKEYCSTMGNENLEAQYTDLQNLPDIIARCVKKGIVFDGEKIINKYYEQAFSVYHYKYMKKFQEAFPDEYNVFKEAHYKNIIKSIENTILEEIYFLDEEYREYELDLLLDDIPDLLKEFGLRFTEKFDNQIHEICGRKPFSTNNHNVDFNTPSEDYIDRE